MNKMLFPVLIGLLAFTMPAGANSINILTETHTEFVFEITWDATYQNSPEVTAWGQFQINPLGTSRGQSHIHLRDYGTELSLSVGWVLPITPGDPNSDYIFTSPTVGADTLTFPSGSRDSATAILTYTPRLDSFGTYEFETIGVNSARITFERDFWGPTDYDPNPGGHGVPGKGSPSR